MKMCPAILFAAAALSCCRPAQAADGGSIAVAEAEMVLAANSCMDNVWTGYKIEKPILIYFEDLRRLALISHPNPPGDFFLCSSTGKPPVYCRDGEFSGIRSNFSIAYKLNGVDVTFYRQTGVLNTNSGRELLFHENFHEFQWKRFRSPSAYFNPYSPAPEEEALYRVENKALLSALLSQGGERLERIADFIIIREYRRRSMAGKDIDRENFKERVEGSAEYAGRLAAVLPCGNHRENSHVFPFIARDSMFLGEIFGNGENFYFSGLLQMAILDALRTPWKSRLEAGESIYGIFKDYFPGPGPKLSVLKKKYGYAVVLARMMETWESTAQKRSGAEGKVFDGPAVIVTVPAAALGAAGPQSHGEFRVLADGRTLYLSARLEISEKDGLHLFSENLPMIMGRSKNPIKAGKSEIFPNRYEISAGELSGLQLRLNGKTSPLPERELVFNSIELQGKGFTLNSTLPGRAWKSGNKLSIEFDN